MTGGRSGADGSVLNGPSFIPRFDSSAIDNSPNYSWQKATTENPELKSTAATKISIKGTLIPTTRPDTDNDNVLDPDQQRPAQGLVLDNFSPLQNSSRSSIFQQLPAYSGIPGMLGVGSQIPVRIVSPKITGILAYQYLPERLINATEAKPEIPVYSGYPGMIGEGQQELQFIQDPLPYEKINITDHFNHNMSFETNNDIHQEKTNETTDADSSPPVGGDLGYSSGFGTSDGFMSSAPGSLGLEMVPEGVNRNSWNGEWPGKVQY